MKGKPIRRCSLCGVEFIGYGHSPYPFRRISHRCCEDCYNRYVLPANLHMTELDRMIIANKDEKDVLKYFTRRYNAKFNAN